MVIILFPGVGIKYVEDYFCTEIAYSTPSAPITYS